jgi:hypothetical protein
MSLTWERNELRPDDYDLFNDDGTLVGWVDWRYHEYHLINVSGFVVGKRTRLPATVTNVEKAKAYVTAVARMTDS